jgi:DNA-binding winged helix-turn-helix (wHTH) protein
LTYSNWRSCFIRYNPPVPQGDRYAFGPFQLDVPARSLRKNGEPIAISPRQIALLAALVSRAGDVLTKDQLIHIGWQDVAVSDNSIEQAISTLRRTLGSARSAEYITTEARRGYRFSAPVTRLVSRETDASLDALLAPHRAWIEGRAALESLERERIIHARDVFEDVLQRVPDQAPVHVGLANAYGLQFEMTRADAAPDRRALEQAVQHAREACRLDANYGEAWATLGFVMDRVGQHADALAAARRAVTLEPDNWRHHVRLAYTAWGEERLRAADRTLSLLPGFPMAHWLAATVHVARHSLAEAERALDAGIAAQIADTARPARFSAVALHWLRGLLYLARGEDTNAIAEFERELEAESSGQLYARECCANTWYAMGAMWLWKGNAREAAAAFERAIERVAIHPMARIALKTVDGHGPHATAHARASSMDTALTDAAAVLLERWPDTAPDAGRTASAVQIVDSALTDSSPPSAGWLIPVEPLLRAYTAPAAWAHVVARLRARAA